MKHLLKDGFCYTETKTIDNEQGMTLLEVLVALLILSLVLVTILNSFALAGRQLSDTYRHEEALALAQNKIEEIMHMDFNDIKNDCTQYQDFTCQVTVVPNYIIIDNISKLITKTVTVTVFYKDEGIEKQLELTAEVSRH